MELKKIVVIGPECTGKSTLSEALAKAWNTVWVPEYAREYLESLHRFYEEKDLLEIAKGQIRSEDVLSEQAKKCLICDTDLYVIKVWSEHKYKRCHQWILEQIASRRYDLYLLTDIDMPWVYDPLREHGDEAMRKYFYRQYKEIVVNSGVPFACISGSLSERLKQASQAMEKIVRLT